MFSVLTFSEPKELEKEKNKKEGIGTFYNLPQYMKLYEVLRGAYSNYKVCILLDITPQLTSWYLLDAPVCLYIVHVYTHSSGPSFLINVGIHSTPVLRQ